MPGDTLDLVPIGAWHGNGRKAQWWSPILLAVWDEHLGRLVAVCKCMSGFTDAFYKVGQLLSLDWGVADRKFRLCRRGTQNVQRGVPKNLLATTRLEVSDRVDCDYGST